MEEREKLLLYATASVAMMLAEEALARIRSSLAQGIGDKVMMSRHEYRLKESLGQIVAVLKDIGMEE